MWKFFSFAASKSLWSALFFSPFLAIKFYIHPFNFGWRKEKKKKKTICHNLILNSSFKNMYRLVSLVLYLLFLFFFFFWVLYIYKMSMKCTLILEIFENKKKKKKKGFHKDRGLDKIIERKIFASESTWISLYRVSTLNFREFS